MLTQEEVLRLLRYDEETGELTWKERPREMFKAVRDWKTWNRRFAGKLVRGKKRRLCGGGGVVAKLEIGRAHV